MARGRTDGRRRNVVSVSLDDNDLAALDYLAKRLSVYLGRPISRSRAVRQLIMIGGVVERGGVSVGLTGRTTLG